MGKVRRALKIKEVKQGLLYMLGVLIVIRIGSQIPVPGVDRTFITAWFAAQSDSLGMLNTLTGGSLEKMSIFALSISPYITSSIIMQLLTVAVPRLEEMSRDGEEGRKKIANITRLVTIGLALIEALAMSLGFGRQGLIPDMTLLNVLTAVAVLTTGSVFLMWIGEQVSKNGIGNGISFVILINILSKLPQNFSRLYEQFIKGESPAVGLLRGAAIALIVFIIVSFVVFIERSVHNIPIRYSRKMSDSTHFEKSDPAIPLKVNLSGVIAVIFASSIMSIPGLVSAFLGKTNTGTWWDTVLAALDQSNWFRLNAPIYMIGYVLYAILVICFAYFYTTINFNPMLIADDLKKSGGVVPGVRPGYATECRLRFILKHLTLIGAAALLIISTIPMVLSGVFHVNLSFAGTSVIIIVGVVIEFVSQIEATLAAHSYRGFTKASKKR